MKQIDKGAEATISIDGDSVLKDRVAKGYRLKEIDEKLRKFRTRREAKVLNKLEELNFPAPRLQSMCDQAMQLRMDMIKGNKIRDVLYQNPLVLSQEMVSIVAPILQTELLFILFLTYIFLKKQEKVTIKLAASALLIIAGVIFISIN